MWISCSSWLEHIHSIESASALALRPAPSVTRREVSGSEKGTEFVSIAELCINAMAANPDGSPPNAKERWLEKATIEHTVVNRFLQVKGADHLSVFQVGNGPRNPQYFVVSSGR